MITARSPVGNFATAYHCASAWWARPRRRRAAASAWTPNKVLLDLFNYLLSEDSRGCSRDCPRTCAKTCGPSKLPALLESSAQQYGMHAFIVRSLSPGRRHILWNLRPQKIFRQLQPEEICITTLKRSKHFLTSKIPSPDASFKRARTPTRIVCLYRAPRFAIFLPPVRRRLLSTPPPSWRRFLIRLRCAKRSSNWLFFKALHENGAPLVLLWPLPHLKSRYLNHLIQVFGKFSPFLLFSAASQ